MATNSERKSRRAAVASITTVVEIPVLSPEEQAEFIDSLEEAEARFDAEGFVEYDPDAFEDRLLDIDRDATRAAHV